MSIWRNIRFGLRAFGQSARARGLGSSARKTATILRTEGPIGVAKRLRALTPLPRARGGDASACLILTTPHVEWIARRMARILQSHGFRVEVAGDTAGAAAYGHVFALTPQMFAALPKGVIAFQMEQHVSDRWMTPDYIRLLTGARAVLDYSQRNIASLQRSGLPASRMFWVPLSADPTLLPPDQPRHGVLFIGDISSPRRKSLLDALKSQFPNLQIEVALFGPALETALNRAKVVLNLHYYDDALLETARIHQARSHGAWVVSETAADQDVHGDISGVIFADAGDVDGLAAAIRSACDGPPPPIPDQGAFAPWFRRALLGLGIIDTAAFDAAHPDWAVPIQTPARLCLSLTEWPMRRAAFLDQAASDDYQLWEGLRASPGWRGAAISHRQIFRRLLAENIAQATICEDDVIFPDDFQSRMAIIDDHLAQSGWDMFLGLIADLPADALVLDVAERGGETFVTLDRACSMVFNIYSPPVMEWLAGWDEADDNAFTNTIDRRLTQRPFRIVTTLPFLVGHREDAASTLREFGNDKYSTQIAETQQRLWGMAEDFRKIRA